MSESEFHFRQNARFMFSKSCEKLGIREEFLTLCIQSHWIVLNDPNREELDDEDLARISLIRELKEDFGANDESIPIILHLLDQLYYLKIQLTKNSSYKRAV